VVWGIQGSGGSVQNVIRVLKGVISRRRVGVWMVGIEPLLQGWGVGAGRWRSSIEVLERHTVLALVAWQCVVMTDPTPSSRPGS